MGSSKDFQTGMICSEGWCNPERSLFQPRVAPLNDFMWSNSLDIIDKQAEIPQVLASYSRFDDSDDHHSSSAELLPVISSDYAQIFQDVEKPQMDDFGVVSDLLHNSFVHDSSGQLEFYNQFNTMFQKQDEQDTEMNYNLKNNFVASATAAVWPKLLFPKLNQRTKHSVSDLTTPLWNSWMDSEENIGAQESDQPHLVSAFFEDQKPYKKDTSYEQPDTTIGTKRKNTSDEMHKKRPRFETLSSLPIFKVRKEKLGDRITALQQLVSPFGKTDTASVLHEAVEYIKFLHDQVLRTPYMQNGTTTDQHQQVQGESENTSEDPKQNLRSRGLCLVPISSTFPVANETTADFWTPYGI